jgi:hypothetical protein
MHQPARDRDGEIFENDLTEESTATPAERDDADHDDGAKTDMDDQTGDEFMHDHFGSGEKQKPE